MSFDIYGGNLRRGHCEVHPHVNEEYPCSICYAEKQRHEHALRSDMVPRSRIEAIERETAQAEEKLTQVQNSARKEFKRLQSKIDMLMLEYCPEEMTQEQKDNWAAIQVPGDA